VLDIEHPLGIRTGALWLLQGDHCYSYFLYANSAHAHHLEARLTGYKLASAMCDGSATNNCVERAGATRGGCNAHARRKLVSSFLLPSPPTFMLQPSAAQMHLLSACRSSVPSNTAPMVYATRAPNAAPTIIQAADAME
jgi:hypothetical protein